MIRERGLIRFAASVFLAGNTYLKNQSPIRIPSVIVPTPVDLPRYRPRDLRQRTSGRRGVSSALRMRESPGKRSWR